MTPAENPARASRRSTVSRARLYVVAGTLIALTVAFAVFALAWTQYAIGQRTAYLAQQVSVLAKGQAASEQLGDDASDATRERLLRIEAGLIGAGLFVTDNAGTVQRSTAGTASAPLPLERLAPSSVSGVRAARLKTGAGVPVVVVATAIDAGHQLVAVQGLAEITRAQQGLFAVAALAALAAAIVAYLAGGVLARRLTAPLVRLEAAADHVAAGAFGTQVAEEGDAETASLAHSFNRMSTRVADAYASQKAFVGDVSHEIRTPLTSIQGFSQALLDGVITDPDRQAHAYRVIHDEAGRIAEMSETLLSLAEIDAGSVEIASAPVDVLSLQDALRGRFGGAAEAAGVVLEVDLAGTALPLGDPDRLLQVVSALVTNALAHTPAGGLVRVSARADAARWSIAVDDSGPGVPAADRHRIFDRFARLDASRATISGGAGLGLSIARRLVELMGGDITVTGSDLGGARFAVTLPTSAGGDTEASST